MILRTEEYRARLVEQRAEWSTYRDAEIVDRFGDPLNEYWAVRDGGLGLADRSERATPGVPPSSVEGTLSTLSAKETLRLRRVGVTRPSDASLEARGRNPLHSVMR